MQRIDSEDVSTTLPPPQPLGSTVGYFKDPDGILGALGTKITADWLNGIQEEISAVIEGAGIGLDKSSNTQLLDAIIQIVQDNSTDENEVIALINSNAVDSYSGNHTLTTANSIVLVDASSGPVDITLPIPTVGKVVNIKKTDSSANAVTILPPSGTIDGAASKTLEAQFDGLTVASDGTNFFII